MHNAKIIIDLNNKIAEIDGRLYGSFVEHLGRAVYDGLYEPAHPKADKNGFRQDVIDTVGELNVPLIRYPGGNFVSGYRWEDGVGDVKNRPRRAELAWSAIESNEIGLHEFALWCEKVKSNLMMAVNLGTRGVEEAADLLEYCNFEGGTHLSELRKKNGREKPFGIKTWCLGNEMDGNWQIGHKSADEYGRLACETAKVMKMIDNSIELVVCGSSNRGMPTFGKWESTVLEHCYDEIDYISLHQYYGFNGKDRQEFLSQSVEMDGFIKEVAHICDSVKAIKNSKKTVNLSFDEWNVWYHSNESDKRLKKWQIAPPQLEDIYNFSDAVLFSTMLNTLIRNSDRVKIACLAQLINVIAPIMTKKDGGIFKQTIFYPFYYGSVFGRGTSLSPQVTCPKYSAGRFSNVDSIDVSSVYNEKTNEMLIIAVNRNLNSDIECEINFNNMGNPQIAEYKKMEGYGSEAANSFSNPDNVIPKSGELKTMADKVTFTAAKESIHFLRFAFSGTSK